MRRFRLIALGFVCVVATLWAVNSAWLVSVPQDRKPRLIAHRGVHQIYMGSDRSDETCRAAQAELRHDFVENTLPSMLAAFAYGADVVELDVHLTTDDVFAVFHDWTLDCQTDGTGVTHDHSMAALKRLDIAFDISADGVSFPLRGTGQGMMPSLREVLSVNPDGRYLVNFKSRRAREGTALADLLKASDLRGQVWAVYGGGPPTRAALRDMPGLRGFDRVMLKACLGRYLALGWSGFVPAACRDTVLGVPLNIAPWLWGWPHRFTQRMADAGSDVILWGPYDGSGFSSGIDTAEMLDRVPEGFDGYIWTNRIEEIGPAVNDPH